MCVGVGGGGQGSCKWCSYAPVCVCVWGGGVGGGVRSCKRCSYAPVLLITLCVCVCGGVRGGGGGARFMQEV